MLLRFILVPSVLAWGFWMLRQSKKAPTQAPSSKPSTPAPAPGPAPAPAPAPAPTPPPVSETPVEFFVRETIPGYQRMSTATPALSKIAVGYLGAPIGAIRYFTHEGVKYAAAVEHHKNEAKGVHKGVSLFRGVGSTAVSGE